MRLTRTLLLLAGAAGICGAGVVQGVVIDHVSGRPLARAMVTLTPVPGSQVGGQAIATRMARAGVGGGFSFTVPEGLYLLSAAKDSYFPASYGARRPAGKPAPIQVTERSTLFAELRMRRRGGVTGKVLDENGVPMAGIPVIAYRARLPLRSAGAATSDDRGIYRVGGLLPGKYWVRTGAQLLDDTSSWLPTFGPGSRESGGARALQVTIDGDTEFADVNPEPGQLFAIGGLITCDFLGPVTVRVSSEAGQRQTTGACGGSYRFDGMAPASYEVAAMTPDGSHSGFVEVFVDRSTENAGLQALESPLVTVETVLRNSTRPQRLPVRLYARRQDLSETGAEIQVKDRAPLPAGYWEMRAIPPPGYYVDAIRTAMRGRERAAKTQKSPDGYEVFLPIRQPVRVAVVLSNEVGRIAGMVGSSARPQAGVPVYLIPGEAARRSLGGTRETVSDTQGAYRFDDLPPGEYRLVASFDVNDIDEDLPAIRVVERVSVDAGKTSAKDLEPWVATN